MADPRFFRVAGPFTVAEIARRSGAAVAGAGEAQRILRDVAPLDAAGPDDLPFLDNRKYVTAFRETRAGAAFVQSALAAEAPPGMTLLVTEQPYRAYALAAQAFYPESAPTSASATASSARASASIQACDSAKTVSASPWTRRASSRCLSLAASSLRMMSRSAPIRRSIVAPGRTR